MRLIGNHAAQRSQDHNGQTGDTRGDTKSTGRCLCANHAHNLKLYKSKHQQNQWCNRRTGPEHHSSHQAIKRRLIPLNRIHKAFPLKTGDYLMFSVRHIAADNISNLHKEKSIDTLMNCLSIFFLPHSLYYSKGVFVIPCRSLIYIRHIFRYDVFRRYFFCYNLITLYSGYFLWFTLSFLEVLSCYDALFHYSC